jgi:heterodisulfide reductase subunit B
VDGKAAMAPHHVHSCHFCQLHREAGRTAANEKKVVGVQTDPLLHISGLVLGKAASPKTEKQQQEM